MLTFKCFWEQYEIPNRKKSKGISRNDMPQILDKDSEHFVKDYLRSLKVSHKKELVKPSTLIPTQKDFSDKGIKVSIKRLDKDIRKPPIIVSKDNYIMDGHHRWAASHNVERTITVYRIDLNADELLDVMKDYDRVKYKKLGSNKIIKK